MVWALNIHVQTFPMWLCFGPSNSDFKRYQCTLAPGPMCNHANPRARIQNLFSEMFVNGVGPLRYSAAVVLCPASSSTAPAASSNRILPPPQYHASRWLGVASCPRRNHQLSSVRARRRQYQPRIRSSAPELRLLGHAKGAHLIERPKLPSHIVLCVGRYMPALRCRFLISRLTPTAIVVPCATTATPVHARYSSRRTDCTSHRCRQLRARLFTT